MACNSHIYRLDNVQFPQVVELYNKAKANYWVPEEYPLDKDKHQFYNDLTEIERHYLLYTLGFFSSAEGWVGQNIIEISKQFFNTEIRMFLGYQLMEEMKHIDTFRYIIDGLGLKAKDIYDMHQNIPEIKAKAEFELKATKELCMAQSEDKLIEDLFVYYAILEGVFFFSGFITPLAFGRRNLLSNVASLVRWILKDETRHLAFGIHLLTSILKTYDSPKIKNRFNQLMRDAVDIEIAYAKVAMPEQIVGLSFETYSQYVKYLADRRMRSLGFEPIYNVKNPMKWITTQTDLPDLTNFFEAKVDY
ncbi:TPA: ribonucleotide reductase [Aquificae Joseph's Coat Spring virus]|nr:TPA: ribonucleotide reductase [Aquificae Joseph's Coat Spring virus]